MLLAQLPAAPSSARVAMWRRLRAAGAASLLTGAWALPAEPKHAALFQQLAESARSQGGQAAVVTAQSADGDDDAIMERFRSDRAREYGEFDQRCAAFLAEIAKEQRLEKFTFAELEEIEDDFEKLAAWLAKIEARDFFPGEQRTLAHQTLTRCVSARVQFAGNVYAHEGLEHPDEEIS
ncbi:MAG: chromate resistance protein ChrB [Sphingosinicella sp.]|nr:chromate resistance protein ChrB [Sphingosinicella sp.]